LPANRFEKRSIDPKWKFGLDGSYENKNDWIDCCALLFRGGCGVFR
jgi:hypothetical protein